MYPKLTQLTPIGRMVKTHGVNGEISILLTDDFAAGPVGIDQLSCIVVEVDGLLVPFYPVSVRPKSAVTDLVMLDGIDSQQKAASLCPATVYALNADLPHDEIANDDEGLYANDLVGFHAFTDEGQDLGKIVAIDDATANVLFIIENLDGKKIMVPIADEFIAGLDADNRILTLSLPTGLLDL